jgi:hypothetical protein
MWEKRGTTPIVLGLLVAAILGALAGCASKGEYVESEPHEPQRDMVVSEAEDAASYAPSGIRDRVSLASEQAYAAQERLIIRNADLAIVVDDTVEALETIEALVAETGGWVVNSNVWEYSGVKRGNITVRVPADELDPFLDEIHSLANEVTNESISGQDVTEEYVDLEAQLTNLEATADRVRGFLDEARDVEEALAVNVELSRLEGEIERITGRMQYLERSARFSSVSIDITPDALAQPVTIGRWQPQGTALSAIQALVKALQWLVDALIVVVLLVLPLLLVTLGPVYLFIRFLRQRRRKRSPEAES